LDWATRRVSNLVPEYFPNSVGAVTGLVGAAGGLGGFFPPLVVGLVKQATAHSPGFCDAFAICFDFACWSCGVPAARPRPRRRNRFTSEMP